MMQLTVDKIASTAMRCGLSYQLTVSPYVVAEEGYCVAVRALEEKTHYNQLECTNGALELIQKDDILVGVLGERQALKGYSGRLPRSIHPGDVLHILNLGGILGCCTSDHPDLGPALRVEVLGAVLVERKGGWCHARIQDAALDPVYTLPYSAPMVLVSGTSMNTGKTHAACHIIQGLTQRGFQVAAAKLTGASLLRDVRMMQAHGAVASATFTDAGVVASTNKEMAPLAKALIAHLNTFQPDVLVLELGDGIIGYYGVDALLLDKEIQRFTQAHVVAATDLAGVWAADHLFRQRYRASITAMTGPVTDNAVGRHYIQSTLGLSALNARQDPDALARLVASQLQPAAPPAPSAAPFDLGLAI